MVCLGPRRTRCSEKEKEVEASGDRNTLSSLQSIAVDFRNDGPRLTSGTDAEKARVPALRDRLFDAYYNKPGGLVINGGEKEK